MRTSKVKLIVGLGNPGRQYRGTRHNVGFEAVDLLSRKHSITVRSRRCKSLVGQGVVAGQEVLLVRPLTYVNLSGEAVSGLAKQYKVAPPDIIVILDDTNLPLGRLRVRARGSAGGHKGMKSIIRALGSEEFPRVRIGISMPGGDMVDYVLRRFRRSEVATASGSIRQAAEAVESMLSEGIDRAMNRFNAPSGE